MSKDFWLGFFATTSITFMFRFFYVLFLDEKAYKKGYKAGYGQGLIHGKVAYRNLQETQDGLSADCYVRVMTGYPPVGEK